MVHTLTLAECKAGDSRLFERLVARRVSVRCISDKYHSRKLLGKGSYGVVHRVVGVGDGKKYAVKDIRKPIGGGEEDLARWRAILMEVEVLAMNDHQNLVRLKDVAVGEEVVSIVTEHAMGVNLHQFAATRPLSERGTSEIASHVLKALTFLHAKGVTHGDVKPENIMISTREKFCSSCEEQHGDDIYTVKLVDYGSASLTNEDVAVSGTGLYLALEVIDGLLSRQSFTGKRTSKSDIYSLGVVLFICLCRSHPFRGNLLDTLSGMREKLSREVDFPPDTPLTPRCESFLISLLKPDPQHRPSAPQALIHPWVADRSTNPHVPTASADQPTCRCGAKVFSPPEHRFPTSYSSDSLSSADS
eukprot:TRINITY_DN3064_c0_g1_i1.p1 TRINITY_DN3064_c0_g1~~TRINITY_DN3064_c0_g1_i1.p1  ORF type:complete len:360 (+),score=50.42 TRINITY_DN3064_c0_g1_i1:104-1183(+)